MLVATHTGGVDRNLFGSAGGGVGLVVATHTGGVDRNSLYGSFPFRLRTVATHTGGVDRNFACMAEITPCFRRHPHGWRG